MRLLYEAGAQLPKVRFIMLLSLASALGSLWAGVNLARTYGLAPGDGGRLAPLPVRLAWGIGVSLLGVGFAAGMAVYGRCYAARIELDPETRCLRVTTIGFLGSPRLNVPIDEILGSGYHAGRVEETAIRVNAPWRSVRLRGRGLPLIVDEQGTFHDRKAINRLFPAGPVT